MKVFRFLSYLIATLLLMAAVSCSEDDGEVVEYENWQAVNENFFNHLSDSVVRAMANDPNTRWTRIKTWSKNDTIPGAVDDYILVNKLADAPATEIDTPNYTDSVSVHYRGRLLPSYSYPQGFYFDSSYSLSFYPDIAVPTKFLVGNSTGDSLIDGFATALQHMKRGDHWMVYIPYKLGYGAKEQTNIPAYSTLIFEIRMVDFW